MVDIPEAIRIPTSLHYDVTGPGGQVIGNAFLDSINNKVITTLQITLKEIILEKIIR